MVVAATLSNLPLQMVRQVTIMQLGRRHQTFLKQYSKKSISLEDRVVMVIRAVTMGMV